MVTEELQKKVTEMPDWLKWLSSLAIGVGVVFVMWAVIAQLIKRRMILAPEPPTLHDDDNAG